MCSGVVWFGDTIGKVKEWKVIRLVLDLNSYGSSFHGLGPAPKEVLSLV